MDALQAVLDQRSLPVLEDAAQAIGSSWRGRPAGALGDVAVFSFHGTKTLTTGEGGMLVTDRDDLFARASRLRDHGRTRDDHRFFSTEQLGYKYKMSSLQAAFGRAQLHRIDELLARKRQIFDWYAARLGDVPGLELNPTVPGMHNTYWMVTVVVDRSYGLETRELMARLDEADVDSRPFFPPLSSLPAFAGYATARDARERNVVAYDLSARSVNLPSALMLTEEDVDRVCETLLSILGRSRAIGAR
jgi:perosamine synthetase